MSYRSSFKSSSFKYSSSGEDDSSSSTRRTSFRSGLDDDDDLSSTTRKTTKITSRTTVSDDPDLSFTTRRSTRLTSDDDSMGFTRRALDDDSTSRLSRRLMEDDDVFASKRSKVEVEGGVAGYSMRSTKMTVMDSEGKVQTFEKSSKQTFGGTFGGEGGDVQMIEDASPVGAIYVALLDYKPLSTDDDGLPLTEGDQVKVLSTDKPRKWKVLKMATGEEGWVGSYCLEKMAGAVVTQEPQTPTETAPPLTRKETLVKELVDTEEDFARDMLFVVENYLREMDNPAMPKRLREFKEQIFSYFKEISDFHNNELINGIKFNAREPSKLGVTLLRMEREFDKHVKFIDVENKAQQLLKDDTELREYFEKFSKKIGDEKKLEEHLKLPFQRINDYQLILKELIKCNVKAGEDYTELQRALDFMQAIPQRAVDLEFITNMEGYSGNIQKFGRILKETTDTKVTEEGGSLKFDQKASSTEVQKDLPLTIKCEDKEEWNKQIKSSTVKSEVVEKMTAEEELRVKEEVSAKTEVIEDFAAYEELNKTVTAGTESVRSVSDLEPRGTSPVTGDKPKFVETLRGVSIHQNDTATLECVIESEPAPTLKWLKNNVPVRKGPRINQTSDAKTGKHCLTITNAQPEDAAMYTIVASNPSGTTSCSAPFNVRTASGRPDSRPTSPGGSELPFAPVFRVKLKDTELLEGTSVRFELVVHGFPVPDVAFYKDGEPLVLDERIRLQFESKEVFELIIDHVTETDSAVYSCVAMNSEGCDSTAGCITVTSSVHYREPAAPTIEACMEDVEVNEGASAMLELKFSGWPRPRIVWTKGEKLIETGHGGKYKFLFEDDNSMTLVIRSVTKEDAGKYDVLAENELGQANTHCNLNVKCPPKFTKELKDASVMAEKPLKLDVEVDGVPEPEVKWYKDGQQVLANDRVKLVHKSSTPAYALVVDKAKVEDAGSYTCVISNPLGSQSGHAAVTVTSAPKIIKKLESYEATVTETVTFSTKVSGVPKPKIEWMKDGKTVIIDGKKYVAAEEETNVHTLIVDCCGPDDVGTYTVVVSNDYGKVEDSAQLTIKIKPRFIKGLEDVELVEGQVGVELTVIVEAKPEPTVQWLHDNVVIKESQIYSTKQSTEKGEYTLVIKEAVAEAGGKIKCTAENKHGKAETEAKVTVNAKPKITQPLKDQSVATGADATFTVKYCGSPKPEAKWMKDEAEIKVDGSHYRVSEAEAQFTLVIKDCKDADKGKYSCIIENKYGKDQSSATLKVAATATPGTPKFAEPLKPKTLDEGDNGTLQGRIAPNADGTMPSVEWLKDGSPLSVDDHTVPFSLPDGTIGLKLTNVLPINAATYTAVLKNPNGEEAKSDAPLAVELKIVKAPKFAEPLQPANIDEGGSGKLQGKVLPNFDGTLPVVHWLKDGNTLAVDDHVVPFLLPDGTVGLQFSNVKPEDGAQYTAVLRNPDVDEEDQSTAPVNVTPAGVKNPTFAQGLKPTKMTEGKPGRLEAKLNPNEDGSIPDVEWFKDGKPIKEGDGVKFIKNPDGTVALEIANCKPGDAGKYTLKAKNPSGGSAESSAPVEVVSGKPVFETKLKGLKLTEGDPLKLVCKVKSATPITAKWFKDSIEIAPDPLVDMKVEPDGSVSLQIASCIPGDAGKYSVLVNNEDGTSECEADVTVKPLKREKPVFVEGLKATAFDEGKPGKLEAKVSGFPKPDVKWLKDGKPITDPRMKVETQPDGTTTLSIDNAKPEDAGEYSVVATNAQGENKSSAPVTVNRKPSFLKPLEGCTVAAGQTAKLTSQVSGEPKPKIEWFKDGKPIKVDGKRIVAQQDDNGNISLTIKDATPKDAGMYSVKASNPMGEMKSEAPVKVADDSKTPIFLSPIKDQSVPEGAPLVLEAKVQGTPAPTVQWFRNGKPIGDAEGAKVSFDGEVARLEIPKVAGTDAGQYECKLISPAGEASSKASVTILKPPKFIVPLSNTECTLGTPLVLECEVLCDDEPEMSWTYNGAPLHDGAKYTITKTGTKCKLFIANPTVNDCGEYVCTAKNPAGQASTKCKGTIKEGEAKPDSGEPPSFLKKLTDQELTEGSTAKFIACIAGRPDPDVKWYKDGVEVTITGRHSFEREANGIIRLVIKNLEASDFGEYRCEISNPHGKADCSAKLIQDSVPPAITDAPDIIRMTDNDCTLRWKPSIPKGPRIPVTYRVEMAEHPDGAWRPYASGIKDTTTDVKGLRPLQDYKFRVLVESKHGLSEPSPHVVAHRSKLDRDDKERPQKEFKPKDIDLGHELPKEGCAPYFVRKEEEVIYGIRGRPVSIEFWVYGLPHPSITWLFKEEKVEQGGRYEHIEDRNGQVLLCINRMTEDAEGIYTCKAENIHGQATKSIRLELAEEPHFTKRLDATTIMLRKSGILQCRVTGKPYPSMKWFKDWLPIADSGRINLKWEEPDLCTMKLDDSIMRDGGLYSCSATNIVGTASCSATLTIEEQEELYDLLTYRSPRVVRTRTKPFADYYDLGEELGRGTQGVTYHAVARATGNSYAAKIMHHRDPQFKQWMKNEMEMMNQLAHPKLNRMWDAFETPDSMSLVTDLCGGGELLNNIIKKGGATEGQIANYMRQTLQGLDYMHTRGIGHLGLTLGDILVARVDAEDIKIGDFSLATRLHNDRNFVQEYGHPEYVAPELAKKEPASLASDMWSVGVITYILLSGISPFLGEHDRETLKNIQDGKMNFLQEGFDGISDDARDFVAKLLVFEKEGRMDVKSALDHPWLKMADLPDRGPKLGNLDRLVDYQAMWRKWYANANCRNCFRRRTLESCFYDPSKMIYPPGEPYSPPGSPTPREKIPHVPMDHYERKKRGYETENFKNESNYAQGPDTYLLQLRDTDFPLRLRQYMKVGASRSPSLATSLRGSHWGGSDIFARGQDREHIYPQVVIRERRKFHDVMDEEIDDEKKGDDHKSMHLRLNKEVGAVGYVKNQMDAVKEEAWKGRGVTRDEAIGTIPFFREKIEDTVIQDKSDVVFRVMGVGNPTPQFTWFRNDAPLMVTSRIQIDTDEKTGVSTLTLAPGMAYDAGLFKCVARNSSGTAVCRARLRIGDTPGKPAAPSVAQASSNSMYVQWSVPKQENNSRTLYFTLEYKKAGEEWQKINEKITNEFYVLEDLSAEAKYEFRVTATNNFGSSTTSDSSKAASTEAPGSQTKIKLSQSHRYQQVQSSDIAHAAPIEHDFSREQNILPLKTSSIKDEYNFSAELASGRFSTIMAATSKNSTKLLAVKAVTNGKREYEMLKGLVHRNIVHLDDAFQDGTTTLLVMERLSMNILSFLTLRNSYTEDQVSRAMKQIFDALEYLHFKDIVFCSMEPDNVCVTDGQSCTVKLVDFGSAHSVPKCGAQIAVDSNPEYLAPEVVRTEPVTHAADVWSAGVLMYILLSGVSPFLGATEEETRENVAMVRFHFEHIYKEASSEVTKFLIQVFKKSPQKRATIEECYENRWMLPTEYMLRKRECSVFKADKLALFAQTYERAKRNKEQANQLLSAYGLTNRITSPEA